MPVKKRKAAPKKRTSRVTKKSTSRVGGIASYVRKIQSTPAVKSAANTIKALEAKLKAAKKKKAAAVKVARKKLK